MPTLFNDCSLLPSSIFRTDNTTTFDPVSASTQIYSHLNQVMSQNDIVILHCSDRPFSEPTSGKESSVTPIERKTDLLKVVDLVVDMIFRDEEVQSRKWSWQDCFKVFVAGWDDKGNLEEIENAYENVQKSTTQELGIQDEAVVEMLKVLKPTPSHRMKDGKQVQVERVPCTAFYHHIPSVRRDTCNKFNEWEVSQRGGNLGIGSWHFMKEIGFKMGAVDKYGA
ncbi:hypothetical protein BKA69DRAFT_1087661 [Paraphysoderma sedebokerense]|nr:hypothetical protein BKA69DRAFT_1087661 [Paraphysoderma sedebokerense]